MRLQVKIILWYSILILAIVLVFGTLFFGYGYMQAKQTALQDMFFVCANLSSQLDAEIRPMHFATDFFLSSGDALSSVIMLGASQRVTNTEKNFVSSAKRNIQSLMYTFFVDQTYYRFNYFNPLGDYLSSDFRNKIMTDGMFLMDDANWMSAAKGTMGKLTILPPHEDPWPIEKGEDVFSVLRPILGDPNLGYIEVQQKASLLDEIFALPETSMRNAFVANPEGDILYSAFTDEENESYISQILSTRPENGETASPRIVSDKGWLIVSCYSPYTGYYVALIQERETLTSSMGYITTMAVSVSVAMFLISLFFVNIVAQRLTIPIRKLKEQIDRTDLANLNEEVKLPSGNDEIESLKVAYTSLMSRLQDSVEKETRLSSLQVLTQFDSLQSQINPHFLYNILNVVSYRGVVHDDETICNICDSLASMLRYSTDTLHRYASIKQEIEHLESYLYLLGTRYLDMLECTIQIDPSLEAQSIPKIVLQQIVENSINHGFKNSTGKMHIDVKGYQNGDNWYIRICDNGQGFAPEVLNSLRRQICQQHENAIKPYYSGGMEIGGMGLLNTHMRLLIVFGDALHFIIGNTEQGGAVVEIGSRLL